MTINLSGYIGFVFEKLKEANIEIGDKLRIIQNESEYVGILMPRAQIGADQNHVVIKLGNGYNIGIRITPTTKILLQEKKKARPISRTTRKLKSNPQLPTVSILSTGGTIASKVDYQTGAVNPALTAEDLYEAVPELKSCANIHAKVLMSKFSEHITPSDWSLISKKIAAEIRNGSDGIVIAHGTDTLAVTAAALSFALQNLPVPVVLVGSQRSSDRPSSDAAMNLIAATEIAGKADAAEVMIVMHGEPDDSYALAHRGNRARKCHTSRRDAFQTINARPLFKIEEARIIELSAPLLRRDTNRKLRIKPNFDERVALLKTYPKFESKLIDYLVSLGYHGIVIEGTGLGHAPKNIHQSLKNAIDNGIVVAMTSQCIWGRVNMNVYRTGVELLEIGVIPCEDMLAETALVKLMWLLANEKNTEKVCEKLPISIVGECNPQSELIIRRGE